MEEQPRVQSIRIDKMLGATPFRRTYKRAPNYSQCHDDVDSGNARILIPRILAGPTLIGNFSSELR